MGRVKEWYGLCRKMELDCRRGDLLNRIDGLLRGRGDAYSDNNRLIWRKGEDNEIIYDKRSLCGDY